MLKIHVVQKGDTLWKLSKKYQVEFETLKKVNSHLKDPDVLRPGMKIKIPTPGFPVKPKKEKAFIHPVTPVEEIVEKKQMEATKAEISKVEHKSEMFKAEVKESLTVKEESSIARKDESADSSAKMKSYPYPMYSMNPMVPTYPMYQTPNIHHHHPERDSIESSPLTFPQQMTMGTIPYGCCPMYMMGQVQPYYGMNSYPMNPYNFKPYGTYFPMPVVPPMMIPSFEEESSSF
ncbi:SafA/ExsA family spore coat assembly protein [Microaerobacter geothermalis]|uniref:SafA/ExsA family spore coat assembly protein n=1 Tax=Microaerobacter geothermalis TaxID=674972 RepID=UPI001F2E9C78|nr:SafA/ExsA family spore coat assembly protein [Microaerobacter geothermalis]MCF6092727.1 SafA/ExsA family spore coat assembly protein [Microaerobacter geothermalis]